MMFRQLKVGERLQPFTGTTGQGQAAMLVIAVVDRPALIGVGVKMNHPDQLSREYAAILPALKDHGYRADVKASIADERFILVVSGKPTTRIYRDGGWVRDDGARGSASADLLSFYKHEHYTEALKHWTNKDWRGIARDLLIDNGVRMGSVLSAVFEGAHLDVEYRPLSGPVETIRFNRVQRKTEDMLNRMRQANMADQLSEAA